MTNVILTFDFDQCTTLTEQPTYKLGLLSRYLTTKSTSNKQETVETVKYRIL